MANAKITKLDASARRYRNKPGAPKRGVLQWEPADYHLTWGEQHFDGPHMLVGTGDEQYGVELRAFFSTHKPVANKPDHYIKDAVVRAMRVSEPTDIVTTLNGKEEMRATVEPGGWIIQNPDGELYYNTADKFAELYEPVDER